MKDANTAKFTVPNDLKLVLLVMDLTNLTVMRKL